MLPTCCICGEVNLSLEPSHPLHCRHSRYGTYRHDTVKQLLASLAESLGASTTIEPRHIVYRDNRRPDIALIIGPKHCISFRSLGAAKDAERVKYSLYQAQAQAQGITFIPFAVETTGGWGPAAVTLVHNLAQHADDHHLVRKA